MGVFFTPNPCKGGRKEENVTSIEWVFADLDYSDEDELRAKIILFPKITPDIVVKSGRGYHLYWKVSLKSKEQFQLLLDGIQYFFQSDPAIYSINEALRLPGFLHVKDAQHPKKVKVEFLNVRPHSFEEMLEAFPPPFKQMQKSLNLSTDELALVKEIPILDVLSWLNVDVKKGFIYEGGEQTSAHVNVKGNYVNRFSGKPGSGSTIDVAMAYGNMSKGEAIRWLKERGNIRPLLVSEKAQEIDQKEKIFTWGTQNLDRLISPIKSHQYNLITGHTSQGKTTFAFHVALKNAEMGHKVLFLSLEQTTKDIKSRLARAFAGITKEEYRTGRISENKKMKYRQRAQELENMPNLRLYGVQGDGTIENIFRLILDEKPDLAIIDNFDLIAKRGTNEYLEQTRIAGLLKDFPGKHGIPLLVLHHRSRDDKGGVNSVRGSSKITHNAWTVLNCFRVYDEDASPEENAKFHVKHDKDRDFGTSAVCTVYFQNGVFSDLFNPTDR